MPEDSEPTDDGNQTGYSIGQDPEVVYNPGYPDGIAPGQPRDDLAEEGVHDLSPIAKRTLGSYLSNLTRGAVGNTGGNTFRIPGGSNNLDGAGQRVDPNATSRLPARRASQGLQDNGWTDGTFLDASAGYDPQSKERFINTKDSDYRSDNPFLNDSEVQIKNYYSEDRRKGQDGNSLLPSIKRQGSGVASDLGNPTLEDTRSDAPLVQKKISQVLLQNRFNGITNAFVKNHTVPSDVSTVQRQLGKYTHDAVPVKNELLERVGLKLIARASGRLLEDDSGDIRQSPLSGIPIIDVVDIRANDVVITDIASAAGSSATPGTPNPTSRTDYVNPDFDQTLLTGVGEVDFGVTSYGTMNSHIERFEDPLNENSLERASAALARLLGLAATIGALPAAIGGGIQAAGLGGGQDADASYSTAHRDPGSLVMGSYRLRNSPGSVADNILGSSLDFLGIPQTKNNWGVCLYVGIASFLGIDTPAGNDASISTVVGALNNATAFLASPGYHTVVVRSVLRDADKVSKLFLNTPEWNASNVVGVIKEIGESSIYRFFMSMVMLGDRVLIARDGNTALDSFAGRVSGARRAASTETTGPSLAIQKAVYDVGSSRGLGWKHSRSPALYVLPESFQKASITYSTIHNEAGSGGVANLLQKSIIASRLPQQTVEEVETQLESEYVPFYFHDIRTNEIISFHAFLSNLSDSYSANYNTTSGYGRIEDVMIYNSTKRSIGVDFHVIATSQEDMSAMYWKINKLVSMLYPQYSRGRVIARGEGVRFVQPFSQIPTASPLIRLRIGDVVKGNYSRFGLARLFGMGQDREAFTLDPEDTEIELPTKADVDREVSRFLQPVGTDASTGRTTIAELEATLAANPDTNLILLDRVATGRVAPWIGLTAATDLPYPIRLPAGVRLELYNDINQPRNAALRNEFIANFAADLSAFAASPAVSQSGRLSPPAENRTIVRGNHFRFPAGRVVRANALLVRVVPVLDAGEVIQDASPPSQRPRFKLIYLLEIDPNSIGAQALTYNQSNVVVAPDPDPQNSNVFIEANRFGPYAGKWMTQIEYTIYADGSFGPGSPDSPTVVGEAQDRLYQNVAAALRQQTGTRNEQISEAKRAFFTERNPIIRSFESSQGRGLAGFITELNMDSSESTWNTSDQMKAPMHFKVSLQFSPIHDIPMGLDSDGMMRSVAYNVGDLSKTVGRDQYSGDSSESSNNPSESS